MQISEMHNSLRLELNKINSNLYDDFLTEEIDAFFNINMTKYVNNKYAPLREKGGFEWNQKVKDDLRKLVVEDYIDKCYTTANPNKSKTPVPPDYQHLLATVITTYSNECSTIVTSTNTTTAYVCPIMINPDPDVVTDFGSFDITSNGVSILNKVDFNKYILPGNRDDFGAYVATRLAIAYNGLYSLYWQNYGGTFYPNQLIVVRNNPSQPVISYTYGQGTISTTWTIVNFSYLTGIGNGTRGYMPGVEMGQNEINEMIVVSLAGPNAEEPMFTTFSDYLSLYTNKDFIVESINMTYLRKPKKMSYLLRQDCELAEHTHTDIVMLTRDHIFDIVTDKEHKPSQEALNTIN